MLGSPDIMYVNVTDYQITAKLYEREHGENYETPEIKFTEKASQIKYHSKTTPRPNPGPLQNRD